MSSIQSQPTRRPFSNIAITFTGYSLDAGLMVLVDGNAIRLTLDQYDLLHLLTFHSSKMNAGRLTVDDVVVSDEQHLRAKIYKIRKAIDAQMHSAIARSLIAHTGFGGYWVTSNPCAIHVDASCDELPPGITTVPWPAFREAIQSARERLGMTA